VAIPSGLQNSRVDSVAIVLHDDAQSTRGVIDIYFDLRRAGMAEGVYNRFAADPVHLVFRRGCSGRGIPFTTTRNRVCSFPGNSCSMTENAWPRSSDAFRPERRPRTALRPSSITRVIRSSTRRTEFFGDESAGI